MSNYLLQAVDHFNTISKVVCGLDTEPNEKDATKYLNILDGTHFISVEKLSNCSGCAYENGSQKHHMECPHGCLHDKVSCSFCSQY